MRLEVILHTPNEIVIVTVPKSVRVVRELAGPAAVNEQNLAGKRRAFVTAEPLDQVEDECQEARRAPTSNDVAGIDDQLVGSDPHVGIQLVQQISEHPVS